MGPNISSSIIFESVSFISTRVGSKNLSSKLKFPPCKIFCFSSKETK